MKIGALSIPDTLVRWYEEHGIVDLYPPQVDCVEAGLFTDKNLLIAIPTASGKTLIAEMAMHHHIARGGKCLYLVPLKALASEKFDDFRSKGVLVGIATGDYDRRDEYLGKNDIVIATSEKADSLLRNNAYWLNDISLLVVDEIHLIDSEDRGATLEMVISKLRSKNPGLHIIGLSATIGNPDLLGGWLDATVVTSDWRPVELHQGVYYHGCIHFPGHRREVTRHSKHEDINLCLDTIAEGGQCLLFVSSRRNAEGFAKRCAAALTLEDEELTDIAGQLGAIAETEMGKVLAACVRLGAAFHHAGLKQKQRHLIEKGFREGHIKVIASTPTLAAGLNLPARRVIIRDYLRYRAGSGLTPIPVREYQQMAGRAGRPRLDPYGEAVLIARDRNAVDELFEAFIESPPEEITSKIASQSALATHILSLIATGFVRTEEGLFAFLDSTFYSYTHQNGTYIARIIEKALQFLQQSEMITRTGEFLHATPYGTLVSRLYLNPFSAEMIADTLTKIESFSDIGLLQLICSTPDMFTLYVRKADFPVLERYIFNNEEKLWIQFSFDNAETYFCALKTALLLNDWMDEVGESVICERYGVGPGDIFNATESVGWLVHAASQLSGMIAPRLAPSVREVEMRVKHGIKRELLPLVSLRGIGRVRARRLFNNNITSIDAIRAAGIEKITSILGRGIAEQIFFELDEIPETTGEKEPQSTLSSFGGGNDDI